MAPGFDLLGSVQARGCHRLGGLHGVFAGLGVHARDCGHANPGPARPPRYFFEQQHAQPRPGSRGQYPNDTWLEITGEMATESLPVEVGKSTTRRQLVIKAKSVKSIPTPVDPYGY